jgi:hypothetical protein
MSKLTRVLLCLTKWLICDNFVNSFKLYIYILYFYVLFLWKEKGMMKKLIAGTFILLFVAVSCVGSVKKAEAVPIDGTIDFAGTAGPTGGVSGNWGDAKGISFGGMNSLIIQATGDYSVFDVAIPAVAFGDNSVFADFDFNPTSTPVTPLWLVTDRAGSATVTAAVAYFDLLSIDVVLQDAQNLNLAGIGTLYMTGYDDTPGIWLFNSTSTTNAGVFSFSANSTPVPEPTTVALLGIGLVGLAGVEVRRRRKKKTVDKS